MSVGAAARTVDSARAAGAVAAAPGAAVAVEQAAESGELAAPGLAAAEEELRVFAAVRSLLADTAAGALSSAAAPALGS